MAIGVVMVSVSVVMRTVLCAGDIEQKSIVLSEGTLDKWLVRMAALHRYEYTVLYDYHTT